MENIRRKNKYDFRGREVNKNKNNKMVCLE